jgi:hypothetical protein
MHGTAQRTSRRYKPTRRRQRSASCLTPAGCARANRKRGRRNRDRHRPASHRTCDLPDADTAVRVLRLTEPNAQRRFPERRKKHGASPGSRRVDIWCGRPSRVKVGCGVADRSFWVLEDAERDSRLLVASRTGWKGSPVFDFPRDRTSNDTRHANCANRLPSSDASITSPWFRQDCAATPRNQWRGRGTALSAPRSWNR